MQLSAHTLGGGLSTLSANLKPFRLALASLIGVAIGIGTGYVIWGTNRPTSLQVRECSRQTIKLEPALGTKPHYLRLFVTGRSLGGPVNLELSGSTRDTGVLGPTKPGELDSYASAGPWYGSANLHLEGRGVDCLLDIYFDFKGTLLALR